MQLLYLLNHYNKPQQIVIVGLSPREGTPLGDLERERSLRCKVRQGKGDPKQRKLGDASAGRAAAAGVPLVSVAKKKEQKK